jgi:hypothetical protein
MHFTTGRREERIYEEDKGFRQQTRRKEEVSQRSVKDLLKGAKDNDGRANAHDDIDKSFGRF